MSNDTAQNAPPLRVADSRLMLLVLVVGTMIGELSLFVVPFMVDGWTTAYGVSEGQIGFVISVRIAAFVVACLLLSSQIHRIDRRKLAFLGAAIIVLANLVTAFVPSVPALLAARIVAGIGEGIVLTTMTAIAAETQRPEKTFSLIGGGMLILIIVTYLLVPPLVDALGVATTFAVLAGAVLVFSPIFWLVSPEKAVDHANVQAQVPWTLANVGVLLAFVMLSIAANAYWFYIERIGERNGMSLTEVGDALVIVALIAIIGPVAAHQVDTKFGRIRPIAGGFLFLGGTGIAFTHLHSPLAFVIALGLASAMLAFCQIYLLGLAAALDPVGRLAAASRGFAGIGNSIAPGLGGGILIVGGGYEAIGWASLAASLLAIAVVIPGARVSMRKASADAQPVAV
jgi:predicted MFS family arabinose efflux permease